MSEHDRYHIVKSMQLSRMSLYTVAFYVEFCMVSFGKIWFAKVSVKGHEWSAHRHYIFRLLSLYLGNMLKYSTFYNHG